ncbi:TPA: DotD/TraH family lipoprotein [Klebsiella aerogenes]
MKFKKIMMCVCGAIALSGCTSGPTQEQVASQQNTDQLIEKNLAEAANTLTQMQYTLYSSGGGLNTSTFQDNLHITSDSQVISFDWEGDAITVLSKLAHARGMNFNYNGVRMPLPVRMHEVKTPYWLALDHVQAQIGYRGVIVVDNDANELSLQFNGPNNTTTGQRVAVIRKGTPRVTTPPLPPVTTPTPTYTPAPVPVKATSTPLPSPVMSSSSSNMPAVPVTKPVTSCATVPVTTASPSTASTTSPLTTKPATGCVPGTGAVKLTWY